tara:strand:+ start:412 stop:1035 length:624 start_codon:yes stop_codon:yes gene_type:complete
MPVEFNMEIAVRNIIACRRRAKPQDVAAGIAWYAEAYEECRLIAWQHNLPVYAVVGVVAALSPNNRWKTNITNARDLIDAFVNDRDMDSVSVCTYSAMKRKAWDILVTAVRPGEMKAHLNGRKIVCFYENIMGEDTCTIDGHARNIAYNERVNLTDNKTNIGVKEYANLQEAYRQAAKRCTVNGRKFKAYELQAVTWVTWRKQHGIA